MKAVRHARFSPSIRLIVLFLVVPGLLLAAVQPASLQASKADEPTGPNLYPAYQINLELIDLLGTFFHRDVDFPEVREVTAVCASKLERTLERTEQQKGDFNLFLLDARMGLIAYSVGLHGMRAFRHPSLAAATDLAVLPSGRVGFLTAEGKLDACLRFDGTDFRRSPRCRPVNFAGRDLSPHGVGHFLLLTADGRLLSLEAATRKLASVRLEGLRLEQPRRVVSDGVTLHLVDQGGTRLSRFTRSDRDFSEAGAADEVYRLERVSTLRIPITRNSLSDPINVIDLAPSRSGSTYLLVEGGRNLLILDPELEPRAYMAFPPMPIPFRQLRQAKGVALYPDSGLLHVFSNQAVSAFSEGSGARDFVLRHTPPELIPVLHAIDSIPIATFDPLSNLYEHPRVEPVLEAAFRRLAESARRNP